MNRKVSFATTFICDIEKGVALNCCFYTVFKLTKTKRAGLISNDLKEENLHLIYVAFVLNY